MALSGTDCARARESVSAELDGELPELELEWQRAHLRVCPACAAWAERVQHQTHLLRTAALDAPSESFVLRRHTRRLAGTRSLAFASTVAAASVAAILALQPGTLTPSAVSAGSSRPIGVSAQLAPQERFARLADGFVFTAWANEARDRFGPD